MEFTIVILFPCGKSQITQKFTQNCSASRFSDVLNDPLKKVGRLQQVLRLHILLLRSSHFVLTVQKLF